MLQQMVIDARNVRFRTQMDFHITQMIEKIAQHPYLEVFVDSHRGQNCNGRLLKVKYCYKVLRSCTLHACDSIKGFILLLDKMKVNVYIHGSK